MKNKIIDFALEYCGIDTNDCFPGRTAMVEYGGVQYDEVFIGIGDTTRQAYNDALENMPDDEELDISVLPKAGNPEFLAVIGDDEVTQPEEGEEEDESGIILSCYVAVYVKYQEQPQEMMFCKSCGEPCTVSQHDANDGHCDDCRRDDEDSPESQALFDIVHDD